MAISVKINFDNVYDIDIASNEMTSASFETELTDGTKKKLIVEISPEAHELMPNVYNLAFGPPDINGEIDDRAQLKHKDYSKVFSTILLHAQAYLTIHPDHYLGIDGSDNSRAFLYYRFILNNFSYLSSYFSMGALKYYVRITRFGKYQYENPFDFHDIIPALVRITDSSPRHLDYMYNYFIFNLIKEKTSNLPTLSKNSNFNIMKDKKVEDRVKSLIEKARTVERPVKVKTSARRRSSLNQIIKTKEQADALMSALKAL